jgi:hypothetical protein
LVSRVCALTREQLESIVVSIALELYGGEEDGVLDLVKEWDSDTTMEIADTLNSYGLTGGLL